MDMCKKNIFIFFIIQMHGKNVKNLQLKTCILYLVLNYFLIINWLQFLSSNTVVLLQHIYIYVAHEQIQYEIFICEEGGTLDPNLEAR